MTVQSNNDSESTNAEQSNKIEHYAKILRHDAYPMYLWGINRGLPLGDAPMPSFRLYIDDFVDDQFGADCSHPLVRILAEQLLLSHQVIGRLCCDAIESDLDARRTNLQLATTLMGEARRQTKELLQIRKSVKGKGPSNAKTAKKGRVPEVKLASKSERNSTPSIAIA